METNVAMYLSDFREQNNKLVVFNDNEWSIIAEYLKLKKLNRKEHFTRAGDVCKELGFVLSGSVRLYHVKDGEEITGYFSVKNEFISSYKSFLKQEPGLPSIQALEDVLLITLPYKAFQELLDNPVTAHKMERFGRLIAENLIFCYEDRMQGFVTQSPQERYTTLLMNNPGKLDAVPQHHLANYLGITATSLSRIRKRIVTPTKQP